MRRKEPWFKLWATDFLTDPDVDELSLEAQGLLLRMWCVCSQRGNIPQDPEEIARLTRCKLQYVLKCQSQCKQFFRSQNGLLYSVRMEAEKAKSERARASAEKRYKKEACELADGEGSANRTGNGTAKSHAQKARKPESRRAQSQKPESQGREGESAAFEAVPPGTIALVPVNADTGAEMQAAVWLFDELAVPSDFGTRNLAAQAIRLQAREWGGIQQAAERILASATTAKAKGETRWRFWFQDLGYLGKSTPGAPDKREAARMAFRQKVRLQKEEGENNDGIK
jgi:uncharacterized protein YdaU (DUF1376 family)